MILKGVIFFVPSTSIQIQTVANLPSVCASTNYIVKFNM